MRKLVFAIVALALIAFFAPSVAKAEGLEIGGHLVTGAGWQHYNNKTPTYFACDGDHCYDEGVMGKYLGIAPAARSDHFNFFVDEVELDLMKSFGENIRLRADLDLGRVASSGRNFAAVVMEQAYATANIPIGNGLEFMLGRFNTPIGFEAVDVADNYTISKSVLAEGLRPTNTTGMKLYYPFSDFIDLHFYVVNTLTQDSDVKVSDMPSVGMRLGFNWGEEGKESTVGISPFFGPESRMSNKHFTFGGDVDVNWWITEQFALGLEALFRRDDSVTRTNGVTPGSNTEYLAGLLNLHYAFSDVWDGTLKYAFAKQYDGGNAAIGGVVPRWNNLTGAEQAIHQISLAGGYQIADGAKLKAEGRFDIINPRGAGNTEYVYGLAMALAYSF